MRIGINPPRQPAGDLLELEIVERKGLGHPDTICDEIAEEFSLALSRYYLAEFGEILHHNVDKVLLAAGTSRPVFGGGEITAPMQIILAGRATTTVGDKQVPIERLARQAVSAWFTTNLPTVDLQHGVQVRTLVHPASADLGDLFARRSNGKTRLANDTSCGIGYAPLSKLEAIVLAVEHDLGLASVVNRRSAGTSRSWGHARASEFI
jgi:S-adenosylmethionine synthetase